MNIKIGTRGSKLALWQAYYVQNMLKAKNVDSEIIIIETTGDKIQHVSLSKIGSKGVFTAELEEQLRSKEIDIAVHSAKDVQSHLPDDLELIAFTERETVNDVLVAYKHVDLENKDIPIVVGTSSTRRIAFMKRFYPHISLVDMRGNLQTRFEKLKNGHCDAMLLAYAGVHRMNYNQHIVSKLPIEKFTPPVGQGSVAIEVAKNIQKEKREMLISALNHPQTAVCLQAERSFLYTMNGGCSVPTFGYAAWIDDKSLQITAGIISLDGTQEVRHSINFQPHDSEKAGQMIAEKVLSTGGAEILAEIKR